MIASQISTRKYLRDELKIYQKIPKKQAKSKKFAIIEGRDIGTEIFPRAKFKIFMWADAQIRARRRYEQILKKGEKVSYKRIYNEIIARDAKDFNRKIAPLMPAVNSVLLDTTYLDIEQVFNAIKKLLDQKYMKQESLNDNSSSEFDSLLAESINNSKLKEGTIIKGTIAEIEEDAIIVDIGAKVEGRVSKESLLFRRIKKIISW